MKLRYWGVLIILVIGMEQLVAQDPVFSMFYMNKLYLNPAYAGVNRDLNVSAISRNQWTGVPSLTRTNTAAVDIACPKNKLGFGATFFDDLAGEGLLRYTYGSFILASHIPSRFPKNFGIKKMRGRKYILSMGLKYSVGTKTLDWSRLVTSDQLDAIAGQIYASAAQDIQRSTSDLIHDLSAGFVYRGELNRSGSYLSMGGALYHINRPVESILGLSAFIPLRWTVHAYANLRLSKRFGNGIPTYLTLGAVYDDQQPLRTSTFGGSFTFGRNILGGIWFRNQDFLLLDRNMDAIIINLIYSTNNFSIGYSYDMTLSTFGIGKTFGTHEIGINYRFKDAYLCKKSSRRTRSDRACFLVEPKHLDKNNLINFLP